MASRIPDSTQRVEVQELKRRFLMVNIRMATLYTAGPLELNQLFSPHKRKGIHSSMPPYVPDKAGKSAATTGKRETARFRITAGEPSEVERYIPMIEGRQLSRVGFHHACRQLDKRSRIPAMWRNNNFRRTPRTGMRAILFLTIPYCCDSVRPRQRRMRSSRAAATHEVSSPQFVFLICGALSPGKNNFVIFPSR